MNQNHRFLWIVRIEIVLLIFLLVMDLSYFIGFLNPSEGTALSLPELVSSIGMLPIFLPFYIHPIFGIIFHLFFFIALLFLPIFAYRFLDQKKYLPLHFSFIFLTLLYLLPLLSVYRGINTAWGI